MHKKMLRWAINVLPIFILFIFFLLIPSLKNGLSICVPTFLRPDSQTPLINVQIENKTYKMSLDFGMSYAWALERALIEKMHQIHTAGTTISMDYKGTKYSHQSFNIPFLKMENLILQNLYGMEENDDFKKNTSNILKTKTYKPEMSVGRIGLKAFSGWNFLFDFACNRFFLTKNSIDDFLKTNGRLLSNTVILPFEMKYNVIFLNLETEVGPKRFFFDTGSTFSALKKSQFNENQIQEFKPGFWKYTCKNWGWKGLNFGEQKFFLFDCEFFCKEMDGVLGLDFIRKHVIFLDFENKKAHISEATPYLFKKWVEV